MKKHPKLCQVTSIYHLHAKICLILQTLHQKSPILTILLKGLDPVPVSKDPPKKKIVKPEDEFQQCPSCQRKFGDKVKLRLKLAGRWRCFQFGGCVITLLKKMPSANYLQPLLKEHFCIHS